MDVKKPVAGSSEDRENGASDAAADPPADSSPASTLETLTAERDLLLQEKSDLVDRLLRRQAEFDNFRRRAERERADVLEYANTETVRAILPVLDDFERALKTESADKEYARGMEMIYQRLSEALKKLGLEPISAKGQKFDPHLHHAVDMVETDQAEDHTVLEEFQQGYNFRGRLLRPAMVKVAVSKK
ncbi:MAG: nucleotide exchange factor GrpE [Acidobacteriia bacterium]|nr:nucleotide exchange factor GrpE [Terriglobia bacterium]